MKIYNYIVLGILLFIPTLTQASFGISPAVRSVELAQDAQIETEITLVRSPEELQRPITFTVQVGDSPLQITVPDSITQFPTGAQQQPLPVTVGAKGVEPGVYEIPFTVVLQPDDVAQADTSVNYGVKAQLMVTVVASSSNTWKVWIGVGMGILIGAAIVIVRRSKQAFN